MLEVIINRILIIKMSFERLSRKKDVYKLQQATHQSLLAVNIEKSARHGKYIQRARINNNQEKILIVRPLASRKHLVLKDFTTILTGSLQFIHGLELGTPHLYQ